MLYKHFKIYFLVLVSMFAFSISCNEKNLDVPAPNATEESYFVTESAFTKTVYGIYARLTDWYNYNGGAGNVQLPVMANLPGDDITTAAGEAFEHFGPLQPGNGRNSNFFTSAYQVVSRANTLLQKIAEENGVYTSPGLKDNHKGEALFLRGLAFYYLWNFYGKAPIVTERVTAVDQWTAPESQGTEMLDQAIADFTEAETLLPASWPATLRGRATKNAANGMLGKSLVFRGTVNKAQADFASGLQALNKINGVSLAVVFADNFASDDENNEESLFEFQASATPGDNPWLPNEFDGAIGRMGVFWGFYDNNFALFGAATQIATQKLVDAFGPTDPRRDITLDATNRSMKKFVTRNQMAGNGVTSVNNPRMLRFADVLLLKAEAVLKSGGSKAEAIGYINDVRTRARGAGAIPANYSTAETSDATIMGWIRNERFLELAGEGQRWFDLRRWHIAGDITLSGAFFDPTNATAMNFLPARHLYFPIPSAEIDKNPNITQNPDY
jgi:starch-binding outer membrane protein, SusD/RagB family